MAEPVERLLHRLAAAGVAEPSTLVLEWRGRPNGSVETLPATAMSSRVRVPNVRGAEFHDHGLVEGYCTYELQCRLAPDPDEQPLSLLERVCLGVRIAAQRLDEQGVPVRRFVLTGWTNPTGGIEHDLAQTLVDVLGERASALPVREVNEAGAEILRQAQSGDGPFISFTDAIRRLAGRDGAESYRRHRAAAKRYDEILRRLNSEK